MDNILKIAKHNFAATHGDYTRVGFDESSELGNIWRKNVDQFLRRFIDRGDVSTQEIMRELNARAFYDFTVTEPLIAPSIRWYAQSLARNYGINIDALPADICESKHLPDERCGYREGRRLSSDFLYRLCQVSYLQRTRSLGESPTILEVGAGYGALARTILLSVPSTRYVIVDIPETLFFAELFLRSEFPHKSFSFVGSNTSDAEMMESDIVLVPTGFRNRINDICFDLTINTNSLGEMPLPVSRGMIEWITKDIQPAKLFSLNRFLNRVSAQLAKHRTEAAGCNFLWDSNWDVVDWEVNPGFEQCPYYMSIVTRNLCLLLSHKQQSSDFDQSAASLALSDIELQDWYRRPYWDNFVLKSNGNSLPLMSKINPDLTPDLTFNGTLFQLWNIMRLSDSQVTTIRAKNLLIEYLEYLGGTVEPFEDLLFFP